MGCASLQRTTREPRTLGALALAAIAAVASAIASLAQSGPAPSLPTRPTDRGGVAAITIEDEYARRCRLARAAPDTADFGALRLSYVQQWGGFGSLGAGGIYERIRELQRRFSVARQNGDAALADRALDELLTADFGNPALHALAAGYFESLGRADAARRHIEIRQRILDSILASGDGRTAETAYPVTGMGEAHMIMRLLGFESAGQALANKYRNRYEILFVAPEQAKFTDRTEVWFRLPW